ncbi:MAG: DUF1206 domain-containing protein [Myxococcota bacterium]
MAHFPTTRIPGTVFEAGYIAKGAIYSLIGILAFQTAIGRGGDTTSSQGALEHVGNQPFGQVLLWLLAIGVFGYAMWRFVDGFLDASDRGSDAKGALQRVGIVISGMLYTGLGISAIRIATAGGGSSGGSRKQEATAWLMSKPGGEVLVAIVGIIVLVVGLSHFWRAYKGSFMDHFSRVHGKTRDLVRNVSIAGLSARGVTFLIIGALVVQAALTHDPSQTGGLDKALQTLAAQPFGPWLLGIVALGLLCYGAYCLCVAYFGTFPDVEISGETVHQLGTGHTAY